MEVWIRNWTKDDFQGWHKTELNTWLCKYGSLLQISSPKKIFIPLCGKSVDIKWFYDGGHSVVGVEGVEKPVIDFFEENGMPFIIEELPFAKLYKTEDERLKLYVCDIFEINSEILGKFDAIWDRGSFVAIYLEDRIKYIKLMKELLGTDFRYLLTTVQYDGIETAIGHPRCLEIEYIEENFGDVCKVQVLESTERTDDRVRTVWKVDRAVETLVLLTPRN